MDGCALPDLKYQWPGVIMVLDCMQWSIYGSPYGTIHRCTMEFCYQQRCGHSGIFQFNHSGL